MRAAALILLLAGCATAPAASTPGEPARDDDALVATYQQDQQAALDAIEQPGAARDCSRDCSLSAQVCSYPPKCFALGHENEERFAHACVELVERCKKANDDVTTRGCPCDSR